MKSKKAEVLALADIHAKIKYKKIPHKFYLDYFTHTTNDCDGKVYWDEGLEGYVCDKCNFYTGIK